MPKLTEAYVEITAQDQLDPGLAAAKGRLEQWTATASRSAVVDVRMRENFGAGGGPNFTRQLRDFGRIAQDAQYGLNGVLNNLVEIHPAVGVLALGMSIVEQYSGNIADAIGEARVSILSADDATQQWAGTMEGFFRGFNFGAAKRLFAEYAELVTGTAGLANRIAPDAVAQKAAAEAAMGKVGTERMLGVEERARSEALKKTISELDEGGKEFRAILIQGLDKTRRAQIDQALFNAEQAGARMDFGAIQARLAELGRQDLLDRLTANRPENIQADKEAETAKRKEEEDRRREAERKQRETESRAQRIIDSTRTEEERVRLARAEALDLKSKGLISDDTFRRFVGRESGADQAIDRQEAQVRKLTRDNRFSAAIFNDLSSAYDAQQLAALQGNREAETLETAKRQLEELKEIREAIIKGQPFGVQRLQTILTGPEM